MTQYLVDKYRPKRLSDIYNKNGEFNEEYFNKNELEHLKNISQDTGLPHIIISGNPGTGKKTMINLFLEMVFDESIYRMTDTKYNVKSSGNSDTEVIIKQSDHHIVIEPNNNNFDRYLIQDVVKEYAKRAPIQYENNKNIKVVQINNLDNLSYYAQTSLRRTTEKYSKTCRFIMWTQSMSKVIEPLRSRCVCIHISNQSEKALINWILSICNKENININLDVLTKIMVKSDGNLKEILWKLDLYKHTGKLYNDYHFVMNKIILDILNNIDITIIRDNIYKIMVTCIPSLTIIKDILNNILTRIELDNKQLIRVLENASEYEYKLSKGRRDIIHIEGFIINIMDIINNK